MTGNTPSSAQPDDVVEEVLYFLLSEGDVEYRLQMTLMRPPVIDGRLPVIVINHGVPADKGSAAARQRARPLSQARLFVSAGFVVAIRSSCRRCGCNASYAMPIWSAKILEFLGDRAIRTQKVH